MSIDREQQARVLLSMTHDYRKTARPYCQKLGTYDQDYPSYLSLLEKRAPTILRQGSFQAYVFIDFLLNVYDWSGGSRSTKIIYNDSLHMEHYSRSFLDNFQRGGARNLYITMDEVSVIGDYAALVALMTGANRGGDQEDFSICNREKALRKEVNKKRDFFTKSMRATFMELIP